MPDTTFDEIQKQLDELRELALSLQRSRNLQFPSGQGVPELPTPPAFPLDISSLLASISGINAKTSADFEKIIEAMRQGFGQVASQRQKEGFFQRLLKKREILEAQRPTAQTYQDILAQFGYTPETLEKIRGLQGQLADFQKQITDLETAKMNALSASEQQMQGRLTDVLRGEQAFIERQFNSKIAAVASKAGIVQTQYNLEKGNLEEARSMADQVIKWKIYDYDQRIADLDFIKSIYSEMTQEEEKFFDKVYKIAVDERDFAFKKEQAEIDNMFRGREVGRLSISEREDLAEDLTTLSELGSREKALEALEKNKTAFLIKYGEEGYNILLSEVDRLYPETQKLEGGRPIGLFSRETFAQIPKVLRDFGKRSRERKSEISPEERERIIRERTREITTNFIERFIGRKEQMNPFWQSFFFD